MKARQQPFHFLCISNNPEEISREGVLLDADLSAGKPARLLLNIVVKSRMK